MTRLLLAALFAGTFAARALATNSSPGTTAAPILELPLSARAQGMGGAFTGVADDVTALQFNPAGLSLLGSDEAYLLFLKGLVDQNVEFLSLGAPLRFRGISGSGYSSVAGSMLFSQNGSIQVNTTNPDGSLASSNNVSAGGDFVGTLAYAERVGDTPIDWSPDHQIDIQHFLGASGKYIHSSLGSGYSASAAAVDLGYLGRSADRRWAVGASALNIGTKMTYISEGDPLPLTVRAGGSYRFFRARTEDGLLFAVDGDYGAYSRQWHMQTGVEGAFGHNFRARLGYQFHTDTMGLTAGFGIAIGGLSFDYAWAMNGPLGDTHRLGLTFRFGEVNERTRGRRRRPSVESFPPPPEMRDLEEQQPRNYNPPKKPPIIFPQQDPNAPVWIY